MFELCAKNSNRCRCFNITVVIFKLYRNLPLYLLTWKIAPCIASGCTAVCKPSEFTSMTAWLLCKAFRDAGLPDGVVNICFGTGPIAGAALVTDHRLNGISFTGGTATGKYIYQEAAKLNIKVSLELGGKNANIIFDDADFDLALTTSIRSSFLNQGEICLCGSRIFVHHSIYQKFIDQFVKLANEMVVGDPLDPAVQLGALVSDTHLQKVLSYVEIAKQEGGKILTGGSRLNQKGYFMRPTIITELHATESRLQQEEIFGPVVTVTPFDTDDEVVAYANSTQFGLSASIWTKNLSRAHLVASQLEVGTVWVNTWMNRDLNMPFGGVKKSGLGREGRSDSMDFYTEVLYS